MPIANLLALIMFKFMHQKYVTRSTASNSEAHKLQDKLYTASKAAGFKWKFNVVDSDVIIREG